MKGFIEVNAVGFDKAILININEIKIVQQEFSYILIFITNDCNNAFQVKESYEEIVNKIKQATEE